MKIRFMRLRIMGKPMDSHLLKVGLELTVYNRMQSKLEKLFEQGTHDADNPAEVAEKIRYCYYHVIKWTGC